MFDRKGVLFFTCSSLDGGDTTGEASQSATTSKNELHRWSWSFELCAISLGVWKGHSSTHRGRCDHQLLPTQLAHQKQQTDRRAE